MSETTTIVTHTPGPWIFEAVPDAAHTDPDVRIDEDSIFWIVEDRHAGEVLGTVERRPRAETETEGNARLMAAAPDLLAACKAIEDTCPCDFDVTEKFHDAWKLMLAAIRKAEGSAVSA